VTNASTIMANRLKAITALVALVSTRIYAVRLPQTPTNLTLPAVRVQQISRAETVHLRGVAQLMRARVQVDAIAQEQSGADPLARAHAVANAAYGDGGGAGLAGFSGLVGSVDVRSIVPIPGQREQYDADDLRQVLVGQDYWLTWVNA